MEQRIDGFKLIEAFYSWVFNNPDKARPTHVSLYLFLWNQNNRSHWVEWFKCPYDLAMQGACIGNNGTYYKCLDELKRWGLIDYQKGINNYKAPIVKLLLLYDCAMSTEQVTVPQSEQLTAQQYGQQTEQLPVHIYKLITNNIEHITENYERLEKFVLSLGKKNTVSESDIELVYKAYPTKCPTKGTSTGKSYDDKKKIKSILSSMPTDKLLAIIQSYVSECTKNRVYMKNFKTFLNNIPDFEEETPVIDGYDFDSMFPNETLSDNTKAVLKNKFDSYKQATGKDLSDLDINISLILDLPTPTLIKFINDTNTRL